MTGPNGRFIARSRTQVGGSWARAGLPAALSSATYNAGNHQTTFGGQTLTYDLNGNLTGDGTNTYTWNARNQLASISGPIAGSFVYDAFGRRQRKTLDGTITDFVYDGLTPVREAVGANTVDLLTGLGIDEYFTRTDSSNTRDLLTDALGSTLTLTDSSGTLQTEYSYEPFGATTASGSTSTNELRYTGREDDGTGVYYYRARYYHPGLQRFISEDPIGFDGGDVNLYAYVANAPVDFVDPSGMSLAPGAIPEYCRDPSFIPMTPELSGRKGRIAQIIAAEVAFLGLVGRALDCSIVDTPAGVVKGSGKAGWALWKMTKQGTERVARHGRFGNFYKSSSDALWWSRDKAGHGRSRWKVFEETAEGLRWRADADEFGNFITGKHKSGIGEVIPWSELAGSSR